MGSCPVLMRLLRKLLSVLYTRGEGLQEVFHLRQQLKNNYNIVKRFTYECIFGSRFCGDMGEFRRRGAEFNLMVGQH